MVPPALKLPRFDIWWVNLPHQKGHVQTGARPAVIVADEPENRFCIVLPVTSNLERTRFKGTLIVEPSPLNGLAEPSVVLGFQIRYLDRHRLQRRIGTISRPDQAILDGIMAELLGFDG